MEEKRLIYLDNAATTRTAPEAVEAMLPYFTQFYGNPSSIYSLAAGSRKAVTQAREVIAGTLGAQANEICFTSGGTEADNWAVKGIAEAYAEKGRHIITSRIEHHAVLHACRTLEKQGFEITYLEVGENGIVDPAEVEKAVRSDTILITVMFANNETGSIQPVREIGEIAKRHGIVFHTDAVQAYGHVPISVEELHIDLLSASAHKFHGPKGVGFLYVRQGVKLRPLLQGGSQERSRRAGTENVPGIVGMAAAAGLAFDGMEQRMEKIRRMRDYLTKRLTGEIPFCRLNGDRERRLPGHVNVSFRFIEGESMLILLDMEGICASSGSACTSGSLDPSHVLLAAGLAHEEAHGSLRLTLSGENTQEELDTVVEAAARIVDKLRQMSPLYEDYRKKGGIERKDVQ